MRSWWRTRVPSSKRMDFMFPFNWVISFAFVGLEVFTGIILAVILKFINVEKNIEKEQAEIKARKGEKQ